MMRWNSTKTYPEDDILRMQQEAVNRVHEFQSRAQEAASFYDTPTIGEYHEPYPVPQPVIEAQSRVLPQENDPEPQQAAPPAPPAPPQPTDPIHGLLEKLDLDGETLLILGLIFLLYNEKADNVLLIALAYLLL